MDNSMITNIRGHFSKSINEKDDFYSVFKRTFEFLKAHKLPITNFLKNYKTVIINKTHETEESIVVGDYSSKNNLLLYLDPKEVPHEIIHMSSSTFPHKNTGIVFEKNSILYGTGLNEGITDLFNKKINNISGSYVYERIVAECLEKSNDIHIFDSYFNSEPLTFMKQFNNVFILSLIKALDKYNYLTSEILTLYYSNRPIPEHIIIAYEASKERVKNILKKYMKEKGQEKYFEDRINSDELNSYFIAINGIISGYSMK